MAKHKRAMVAPVPAQPAGEYNQTEMQGFDNRLAMILRQLGNTRSYTLIRRHANSYRVLFDGDYLPSTVKEVEGAWSIIPDNP